MNLREIKLKRFDSLSQTIIFDENGKILDSDNSIAEVNLTFNIYNDSLFFEGMNDVFKSLGLGEEVTFDCVDISFFGKSSHYDFVVKKMVDEGGIKYCWITYDFGPQYKKVFELQQERNVRDIESRRLEREKNKISDEKEAIEKLYGELNQSDSTEYILLKSDNLLVNVDLNAIHCFEGYGDYIKVHTDDKTYIIHKRMKDLDSILPAKKFVRVHRSFIVQLNKIENIEQLSIKMGNKIIPIGKNNKQDLLNSMNQI
ncbi:MAG: LytR/AlgR family response regulator transcription factor [Ekhidna sp.]